MFVYFTFVIAMTILLLNFNDYGVTEFGNKSIIIINDEISNDNYKKGDIVITEFRQRLNITPGKYTLSFSCTRYDERGELEVLSRKYDALIVEVISDKVCVGIAKIEPDISINKINK